MKKPQLFLLHFAGGNSYSFTFLESLLKEFEVIPLELPGRGKRLDETLLTEFDPAARDIFNQVSGQLSSPVFLIYGHSMGAYLALRVANMLERSGKFPLYVIVSGSAGPGVSSKKHFHLLAEDEFIEELGNLGGVPPELIANKELFDFFEPILRADFGIVEKNEMADEPPITAPLYVLMGSKEEDADKISNWSKFTRSAFDREVLEGDHFFIHKHSKRIADVIKGCYDKACREKVTF